MSNSYCSPFVLNYSILQQSNLINVQSNHFFIKGFKSMKTLYLLNYQIIVFLLRGVGNKSAKKNSEIENIKTLMVISQSGQRFLEWKFKNNSRTFQERINTFQEHKRCWKYYNNRFEGVFFKKKLNLVITKDKYKYQQE